MSDIILFYDLKFIEMIDGFQVDMTALKQMGDNDLKELGIPMVFLSPCLLVLVYSLKRRFSFRNIIFILFYYEINMHAKYLRYAESIYYIARARFFIYNSTILLCLSFRRIKLGPMFGLINDSCNLIRGTLK